VPRLTPSVGPTRVRDAQVTLLEWSTANEGVPSHFFGAAADRSGSIAHPTVSVDSADSCAHVHTLGVQARRLVRGTVGVAEAFGSARDVRVADVAWRAGADGAVVLYNAVGAGCADSGRAG